MLGADYDAVGRLDQLVGEFLIIERVAGADSVGVVEGDLFDERVVIAYLGTARAKQVDDRESRRLAHVVDVLFVCHPEDEDPRSIDRLAGVIERGRDKLYDICRHA